jgi:hypothetical protein
MLLSDIAVLISDTERCPGSAFVLGVGTPRRVLLVGGALRWVPTALDIILTT